MTFVAALNIECEFFNSSKHWAQQDRSFYLCKVKNTLKITKPGTIIDTLTGSHISGRQNSNVEQIEENFQYQFIYFHTSTNKLQ